MNKVYPDESIHSYLIRALFRIGSLNSISSLSGIISSSGVVRASPKILTQHAATLGQLKGCDRVKSISKHANKELHRRSIQQGSRNFEIDIYEFYNVNSDEKIIKLEGHTQLRFCLDCFKEQIQSEGVAWFRFNWLFQERCNKHNKLMTEVRSYICACKKNNHILIALRSVMVGYCHTCGGRNFGERGIYRNITNSNRDYPGSYRFHKMLYAKPTLEEIMEDHRSRGILIDKIIKEHRNKILVINKPHAFPLIG
tara:strand:- start:733 stop:1494 length:762 start_codon:yes stop_codon:yes gene_type:complete